MLIITETDVKLWNRRNDHRAAESSKVCTVWFGGEMLPLDPMNESSVMFCEYSSLSLVTEIRLFYFFSCLWTFFRWRLRMPLWEKTFGQWGHTYGFSPVCFLRWTYILQLFVKVRPQPSWRHMNVLLYLFVLVLRVLMVLHIFFEIALKPFFPVKSPSSSELISSCTCSSVYSFSSAWFITTFSWSTSGALIVINFLSESFLTGNGLSEIGFWALSS